MLQKLSIVFEYVLYFLLFLKYVLDLWHYVDRFMQ